MPTTYVSKVARKKGMESDEAERRWKKAKRLAADAGKAEDYAYIMGIFKKMMGEQWFSEEGEPTNTTGEVAPDRDHVGVKSEPLRRKRKKYKKGVDKKPESDTMVPEVKT